MTGSASALQGHRESKVSEERLVGIRCDSDTFHLSHTSSYPTYILYILYISYIHLVHFVAFSYTRPFLVVVLQQGYVKNITINIAGSRSL